MRLLFQHLPILLVPLANLGSADYQVNVITNHSRF